MTALEIVFLGIIWLFVGLFICYKRNWYKDTSEINDEIPIQIICLVNIILTPLSLFIAFIREMIIDEWNNTN